MAVMVVCSKVARCFRERVAGPGQIRGGLLSDVRIARAAAARMSGKTAGLRRRWRRVNNQRSWLCSLKPFAGVGVAYAHHEEAKAEGQHDDIPHENAPVRGNLRGKRTIALVR